MRKEMLEVRCELYHAAKHWELLIAVARGLARKAPGNSQGWIMWAFALREQQKVAEARDVLLEAEPHHPKCGNLHYNLSCYYCLLGDQEEAKRRLRKACKLEKQWKAAALDDPDLKGMWDQIASL